MLRILRNSKSHRFLTTNPRWSGEFIHVSDTSSGVALIELDRPKGMGFETSLNYGGTVVSQINLDDELATDTLKSVQCSERWSFN